MGRRGQKLSNSFGDSMYANFEQEWTLDETGNWAEFRQADDTGGGTGAWDLVQVRTHNPVNEISNIANSVGAAWAEPEYDDSGNMIEMPQPNDPGEKYYATYDAWNRLVRIEFEPAATTALRKVQEYEYDGRHFRTLVRGFDPDTGDPTGEVHSYYTASWQLIENRFDSDPDEPFYQHVWGTRYIDDLILRDRASLGIFQQRLYALQDANFNVVALYDADAGEVVERYDYTPYGQCTVLDDNFDPKANNASEYDWAIRYAGYRYDAGTGLYCVRWRYLHWLLGRWVIRDPMEYVDGYNLYEYATSAPLQYPDPTGLVIDYRLGL